ncbi:MAG TPA: AbrB/MazE/SpoVT family DNA-binding domain-containing protein [Kiloniellales bacterium]|jgi:antitoxin MazE|nr:AbrB/MazE/SpoVT family DNA-binding domain-containing protein [Kiloniellales bacterium]
MRGAVSRWGNSIAVRIPKAIAEGAHLKVGDEIKLELKGESIVMTPARKRYALKDLLAQMKPEHRHEETDWGEPQGEEVW